jgi:hypothetical protein
VAGLERAGNADTDVGHPVHLVVELVGPAGCGKTSVASCLLAAGDAGQVGVLTPGWRLVLAAGSVAGRFVRDYAVTHRGTRWFTVGELRSIGYLVTWPRQLVRQAPGAGPVVLDQGPLYRLARLEAFGPPVTRGASYRSWSAATAATWSSTLGLVVSLDATDDVLVARIRQRRRAHAVRDLADGEAAHFLGRYRAALARATEQVTCSGRVPVLRVDTSHATAREVAALVSAACPRVETR